jgi:hypothetical protein
LAKEYMVLNRNGGTNSVQISIQPNIELDGDARHAVVEILNIPGREAVLAMKTRSAIGAAWSGIS